MIEDEGDIDPGKTKVPEIRLPLAASIARGEETGALTLDPTYAAPNAPLRDPGTTADTQMPREQFPSPPASTVATLSFRPPDPRRKGWAVTADRSVSRDIELQPFRKLLERLLTKSGLPSGCVSEFATVQARCRWHSGSVRFKLRLGDGSSIRFTHCGCADWRKPDAAPPKDIQEMARSLAGHVVWYWQNHGDFMVMDPAIADACEREAAKDRAIGLATTFAGPKSVEFDTFLGRDQEPAAFIDTLHDSLLRQRWRRTFRDAADVSRFFRSMRPPLRSLAECRDEYAAAGADGVIDRLAVAALQYLGIDPLPVITDLAATGDCRQFDIDGARLLLRWRFKMIRGVLKLPAGVDWAFGTVDTFKDRDGRLKLIAHDGLAAILSSAVATGELTLRCEGRSPREIDMLYPTGDLFAVTAGAAHWVGVVQGDIGRFSRPGDDA